MQPPLLRPLFHDPSLMRTSNLDVPYSGERATAAASFLSPQILSSFFFLVVFGDQLVFALNQFDGRPPVGRLISAGKSCEEETHWEGGETHCYVG